MTSTRRFTCDDLFQFNGVNLDYFTETVKPAACDTQTCIEVNLTLVVACSTTYPFTCNIWQTGQNTAWQHKGQAKRLWAIFWANQKGRGSNGMAM